MIQHIGVDQILWKRRRRIDRSAAASALVVGNAAHKLEVLQKLDMLVNPSCNGIRRPNSQQCTKPDFVGVEQISAQGAITCSSD
jgi:hypothetical protein